MYNEHMTNKLFHKKSFSHIYIKICSKSRWNGLTYHKQERFYHDALLWKMRYIKYNEFI